MKGDATKPVTGRHWLVKSEPESYSWGEFFADGGTAWTGVRSFAGRRNLRAMRVGDRVLYYHSVSGKAVVGVAKVARTAYPDPTVDAEDKARGEWVCVDLKPVRVLEKPVTLEQIKADPALKEIALVRQGRLSVVPLTEVEFSRIVELGG